MLVMLTQPAGELLQHLPGQASQLLCLTAGLVRQTDQVCPAVLWMGGALQHSQFFETVDQAAKGCSVNLSLFGQLGLRESVLLPEKGQDAELWWCEVILADFCAKHCPATLVGLGEQKANAVFNIVHAGFLSTA